MPFSFSINDLHECGACNAHYRACEAREALGVESDADPIPLSVWWNLPSTTVGDMLWSAVKILRAVEGIDRADVSRRLAEVFVRHVRRLRSAIDPFDATLVDDVLAAYEAKTDAHAIRMVIPPRISEALRRYEHGNAHDPNTIWGFYAIEDLLDVLAESTLAPVVQATHAEDVKADLFELFEVKAA